VNAGERSSLNPHSVRLSRSTASTNTPPVLNLYFRDPMKLTLISSSFKAGDSERVMSNLANYWAGSGWKITLITFDRGSEYPFYDLDPRIDLRPLGIESRNRRNNWHWRRIFTIRKAIKTSRPDVVISFVNTTNILTLLACLGLRIPTIVTEHVHPEMGELNKTERFLQKWTYRLADLVTVQTYSGLSCFPAVHGYRTAVLPNPIEIPDSDTMESLFFTDERHLLAVGELIPQKGFDLLIRAFAKTCAKHPEWILTILGEGEMRAELEDLCAQLRLEGLVRMPGTVKNIDPYLRKADIFALTSRFEGFPVILGKAMACGVPVIATDCLSGPREMIHHDIDGFLVASGSVDALATGLNALMSDPAKRQQFAHYAPRIIDRFGVDRVMGTWNSAIKQVAGY
jgi:GalNAc-alpha-(1->4)-GalNAc-alpha-(1->3)-diNAcBac-PP-undecaprenol alpha-1,4-N-acetyl-D-galactosaminyltransferase